jgi:hypothetical protein
MELLLVVVFAAVLWFVLSGNYKTELQDPQTLRPGEIEDSIIELKKKILVTSAYTAEAEYQRLYRRLSKLMAQVLERHQHFILDVEAKGPPPFGLFRSREHHDSSGMTYTTFAVPYDLNPSNYDPDLLMYTCFFLWQGGQAKDIGNIESNPKLMLNILDFLIDEKSYAPAIFMKGMVKKYGLKVYSECFPTEARELLEKAHKAGVGSAAVELERLSVFFQLAGIKSVQIGE